MESNRVNDPEQPYELVLIVTLQGYGKAIHKEKKLAKVRKELMLQFDNVTVEEQLPSLKWKAP